MREEGRIRRRRGPVRWPEAEDVGVAALSVRGESRRVYPQVWADRGTSER